MSKLKESYQKLGLERGASMDQIKQAHRRLVTRWHPDKFQNEDQQEEANSKIKQINAAYTYLSTVKRRTNAYRRSSTSTSSKRSSDRNKRRTRTRYESGSTSDKSRYHENTSSSQTDTHRKQEKDEYKTDQHRYQGRHRSDTENAPGTQKQTKSTGDAEPELERGPIARFIHQIRYRIQMRSLNKRRSKRRKAMFKQINRERAYWEKLRSEYESRTRVGLYRSLFNALIFGRIFTVPDVSSDSDSTHNSSTSIGSYNISQKYETDLRHSLIQDQIFYAFNKGTNIVLKFGFGIFFVLELIYFFAQFYIYGLFPNAEVFVFTQLLIIMQFGLLIGPDNFFQRYLLWLYRNLSKQQIQNTFKASRLPQPWNTRKRWVLVLKYVLLFLILWWFHFSFLPDVLLW